MKIICKMQGGSHSYGLNTPTSDIDIRGVFLNDDVDTIIGLGRYEHQDLKTVELDSFYWEFRHFLNLLRKGNTQALELLFNNKWISLDYEFSQVIARRNQLIDTAQMFKSLKGYIYSERRLANGERTGKLGSKRKAAIDLYDFSPKNVVQLLRLSWAGTQFFKTGEFPVNIADVDPVFCNELLDIKLNPQNYDKAQLMAKVDQFELMLNQAFDSVTTDQYLKFDYQLANKLILEAYLPVLQQSV
jgi:predicted nucleotidyltransferase